MRSVRPSAATIAVLAAAAIGLALRVWVLASPLGALDSDEAVKGLMARHALDGELSVFFWLQAYGGAQDAWLTALVFAVFGSSVVALKLAHIALWAAAALLLWRVGRWTVGEPAARLSAAVFWLWPPYLVWFSTKAYSVFAIPATLVALLFLVRLAQRDSRLDAAAFGFAAGIAWWALAERTALLLAPALVWLAWRRTDAFRLWWLALPAFVAGATPWIAWNVRYDWLSLRARPGPELDAGPLERGTDLFSIVVPTWLGLRVPGSLDWLVPRALGIAIVAAVVLGIAALVVLRPRGLGPFALATAAFPIAYASSPFTAYVLEPRYLVFIAPALAVLAGAAIERAPVVLGVLALASVAGLVAQAREGWGENPDTRPAIALLEREGELRVLAAYRLAYPITFVSGERVIATSTEFVRYVPHDELVRASPDPARVYIADSEGERAARSFLERAGYRRTVAGELAVYRR